eukprot:TRINITY_DN10372_c0_g1_i1.p1 TRINITY_DN10372_c0_g1~~TRINITY_DN10372_c0_g1_i1.p1  ORF type:complete len:171 (+),score=33.15 TRINITY_DN10372_c0_g1_i1:605-1117(+)
MPFKLPNTGGCEGACAKAQNCLKVSMGLLALTGALILVTAFVLLNVSPTIYHYPYFCIFFFVALFEIILTLNMACSPQNYCIQMFLHVLSYVLVSLGGVIFYQSIYTVQKCSAAGTDSITLPACSAAYTAFLGTMCVCSSQVILGLILNKGNKKQYNYVPVEEDQDDFSG